MSHHSPSLTAAVYAKDAGRLAAFYAEALGLDRVDDVEAVRPVVARLGGGLAAPDAAWSWRGQLHLDGWDPEGNVFQLRQPLTA